jgi:hypothetical protein
MADNIPRQPRVFSRWLASGLHLLISAAIALVAIAVMLGVWYPSPFFAADGGSEILFIMIAVDIVIGPLITLVIFKSGKPGLRFDLTVIALLQFSALVYGCHVMFVARPAFIVFVVDQFESVSAVEIDSADLAGGRQPEFRSLPLSGPLLVAVEPPKDEKERADRIFEAVVGGKDLRHYPKYYVPYSTYKPRVIAKSRPVEKAREHDMELAGVIDKFVSEAGPRASELRYLPLRMRRGWGAALIDAKTGDVVKLISPHTLFGGV